MNAAARFARAWSELDLHLDWPLIGRLHCDGGGDGFLGEAARAELFDAALLFATDLEAELPSGGQSLYVGASIAELVPMLVETFLLGRRVLWREVPGPIVAELDRALRLVAARTGETLPMPDTSGLATVPPASCDHLWLVSVLTDPDHFPALHDHLYERTGELATRRGDLATERARAVHLVAAALDALQPPAWLTTTDEELALVAPECRARGLSIDVSESARLSPLVGDPVRSCRVGEG